MGNVEGNRPLLAAVRLTDGLGIGEKMKAVIDSLYGKYYGTTVRILDGKLKGDRISIWFASGNPSSRQIESWGHTQEEWDSDAEVDDGFGGKTRLRSGGDMICDNHYECDETLRIAEAIVTMLAAMPNASLSGGPEETAESGGA